MDKAEVSFTNDLISPHAPERSFADEVLTIEDLNIPPYDKNESFKRRRQIIYEYLNELDESEREIANGIADDLLENDKPLANTVVIIPVAAQQEAAQIPKALESYAKQDTNEPFTVVLGLNHPLGRLQDPGINETEIAIDNARSEHPNLDVRSTLTIYDPPIIGEVRRDLWNGVAMAANRNGNFEENIDVIGINHDIDLVRLSKTFISAIQHRYKKLDERHIVADVLPVSGTLIKHAKSPQHPNISNAVFWSDYVIRKSGNTFEAGLVIPFSRYAYQNGFDPSSRTHETQNIMHTKPILLQGTKTETSPRRYIARMQTDGYDIWSPKTFSAEDKCRETTEYPDITKARMNEIIAMSIKNNVTLLLSGTIGEAIHSFRFENGDNSEALTKHIEVSVAKVSKVTNHILRNIVGFGDLSDIATELLTSSTLIEHYTNRHLGVS
jgi:hypothetical protein